MFSFREIDKSLNKYRSFLEFKKQESEKLNQEKLNAFETRRDEIFNLYQSGMTMQSIGDKFGLNKSTISRILHRKSKTIHNHKEIYK